MKIIHIESGLGNQMLSYCEYIAIKKMNPTEDCYIENIIYDIPECNEVICQWNGYELNRIFGINAPNIKNYCTEDQWLNILDEVRASEFWNKNWNYPVWFTNAFNNNGFNLVNMRGNFEDINFMKKYSGKKTIKSKLVDTYVGNTIKRLYRNIKKNKYIEACNLTDKVFIKSKDDIFTGQFLSFKLLNNSIELIEDEIKFFMVKTLGESHPDENYKITREFYKKLGFYPLEEIKEIWGESNPCLIMVKTL